MHHDTGTVNFDTSSRTLAVSASGEHAAQVTKAGISTQGFAVAFYKQGA